MAVLHVWEANATHITCPGTSGVNHLHNPVVDATEACFGVTLANAMKSDIVDLVFDKSAVANTVEDYGFLANAAITSTY